MHKIEDLVSQLLFLSYSNLCEINYILEIFSGSCVVFAERKSRDESENVNIDTKLITGEFNDEQNHEKDVNKRARDYMRKTQATVTKSNTQVISKSIDQVMVAPINDDICQHNRHDLTLVSRDLSRIHNLADLRAYIHQFTNCGLVHTATQAVFADGNPQADIMIVGEAPGAEEDKQGLPFVGRAGSLLNQVLHYIGLTRSQDVYITNVVPWRPPGNRTPTNYELDLCVLFIRKHIELCAAKRVILLGAIALRSIIGCQDGIIRTRGQWFQRQFGDKNVKLLATYHPAFLLRQPIRRREFWLDFLHLLVNC